MQLLSYDIEIFNEFEDAGDPVDLHKIIPSVAAICTNENDVEFFYDKPYMSVETSQRLVRAMIDYYKKGFIPWGWNTTGFDFKLLGYYSGMVDECAELAMNGIDGMLLVTFNKGFYLGLDTALIGAKLDTKTHKVQLNDGSFIEDMSGAKAPEMWRNGEYDAVMTYLKGDVIQPLKLAEAIENNKGIRWTSKSGKPMFVNTSLDKTKKLFAIPEPDTSWMGSAPTRKGFVDWMPENILTKYGIKV
jgi:hypothetical protein